MYRTLQLSLISGYGGFSRSVLGACACAFFTTGVQNCVMSYVLPAARCELQLTTYQAGLINMAFMSGKSLNNMDSNDLVNHVSSPGPQNWYLSVNERSKNGETNQ